MSVLEKFKQELKHNQQEPMTLEEYLELCKKDRMAYATAAERMVAAIGEPELVDTSNDPRLSRLFQNRTIKRYKVFEDFYGAEETIERVVGFFNHAAQGLEERKQVLYLLGPVGSAKSSMAERLKALMEKFPIYVLAYKNEISPVFESPLGIFDSALVDSVSREYNIPPRYFTSLPSPWAVKRMDGSVSLDDFKVVKLYPSKIRQIGVMKTEPGDENNQDISTLVGKVDIRKLEHFSQNDPDCYSFSGGLNRTTQGMLEFVEMFKAPIKVLHPLLTATQEGNYVGTEAISAIPFQGIILAHSNESEWKTFRNNKNNEAFLDRICVIKLPYCLRVTEEQEIYRKMLSSSSLKDAACAPETLRLLAEFCVMSRLTEHENSHFLSKMKVYDGQNTKDSDPRAKSLHEYKTVAGVDEGMSGISTRFAFKRLSEAFNLDPEEVAADPVHLLFVLEKAIRNEQFPEETEKKLLNFVKGDLAPRYAEYIGNEIQKAYLESYADFGQNTFDNYVEYADAWIQDRDYKDPDTHLLMDRSALDAAMSKIEKPAGIANPKDFRHEVVNFCLRARAKNGGKNPSWTSYEKLREVVEKTMFGQMEDMLPVISFGTKKDKDSERKHTEFVSRMVKRGYTEKQARRLVEWHSRIHKAN